MRNSPPYAAPVRPVTLGQHDIYITEKPVLLSVAMPQHYGAQRRAQRQCDDGGYYDRNRYGNGKLPVKLSGYAGKETDRDKYRAKHHGSGYQGAAKASHGLFRSLIRGKPFFFHDSFHILNHDYGIVHHDSDGKYQSQQRHEVQRKAEDKHHPESSDKRNRYRHYRDERGPPALQ